MPRAPGNKLGRSRLLPVSGPLIWTDSERILPGTPRFRSRYTLGPRQIMDRNCQEIDIFGPVFESGTDHILDMDLSTGVRFRSRCTLDLGWDLSETASERVSKMVTKSVKNVFPDQNLTILSIQDKRFVNNQWRIVHFPHSS